MKKFFASSTWHLAYDVVDLFRDKVDFTLTKLAFNLASTDEKKQIIKQQYHTRYQKNFESYLDKDSAFMEVQLGSPHHSIRDQRRQNLKIGKLACRTPSLD